MINSLNKKPKIDWAQQEECLIKECQNYKVDTDEIEQLFQKFRKQFYDSTFLVPEIEAFNRLYVIKAPTDKTITKVIDYCEQVHIILNGGAINSKTESSATDNALPSRYRTKIKSQISLNRFGSAANILRDLLILKKEVSEEIINSRKRGLVSEKDINSDPYRMACLNPFLKELVDIIDIKINLHHGGFLEDKKRQEKRIKDRSYELAAKCVQIHFRKSYPLSIAAVRARLHKYCLSKKGKNNPSVKT